jgi:hypothetical protein
MAAHACFKYLFSCVSVAKVDLDIAYVAMAKYTCMFQEHVSNVSSILVVCYKYFFIYMFQK